MRCCSRLWLILALLLGPAPLRAQQIDSAPPTLPELDPESPMEELPGLGVDWPVLAPDVIEPGAPPHGEDVFVTTDQDAERRYTVILEGAEDVDGDLLNSRFSGLSALKAGEGKPANVAQIDRRAKEDAALVEQLLRASGYYDGSVATRVEKDADGGRLRVIIAIVPGPLYRFADVQVDGIDPGTAKGAALLSAFDVTPHDPVNADDVALAEATLKATVTQSGYPFAKVQPAEVVLDHESRTAQLVIKVDLGDEQRIGQVIVKGSKPPFGARHVERLARWKRNEVYNQARIEDLKRAILATGLVSIVKVEPVKTATPGLVDLAVTLEPSPPRTVAGEAGYGTGEGFTGELSWTHRNLLRPEGAVTFRGALGTQEQSLGAVLRMGNFKKRDQVLNARLVASSVNLSAYDARTVEIGASLERQTNIIWQKKWTWSVGLEALITDERDASKSVLQRETYIIAALPLTLTYDGSNDLLDPTRGFRLSARLEPEKSFKTGGSAYVRAQLDGSYYQPVTPRVTLAGRVRLGAIAGAPSLDLAPSRRFYAGGGSSVRGYGYQNIGPRDAFNDPVGGRSLTEFALEARVRFGEFSVVPFFDGGNIYDSAMPKFSGFRYGAGVGVRYHSSFGPIRIDVGTPLNRQNGDSRIGVYVSLGQAF